MSLKKITIYYLLIACLALLPAMNGIAGNTEQMDPMPISCIDCDHGDSIKLEPCTTDDCLFIAGLCWSQSGASTIPGSLWGRDIAGSRMIAWDFFKAQFRSYLATSIYRPPIT